ncbi:MAG: hypothetical protein EXX96DRAFT_474031, partial [Benjaminiella poitrasii]
ESTLLRQVTNHNLWRNYSSRTFRMHDYEEAWRYKKSISSSFCKLFWRTSMLLQARSLWHRVAHEKVLYQDLLFQYNAVNSSSCPLCGDHDTIVHFLVECPTKWQVWSKVLRVHFPILDL